MEKQEYVGLFLDEEQKDRIFSALNKEGIEIQNSKINDFHITLAHFSNKEAMEYANKVVTPGDEFTLKISSYGELRNENGVLLNQGLKIEQIVPDGDNKDVSKYSNNAHITLSVNKDKNPETGKNMSNAMRTKDCVFDKPIEIEVRAVAGISYMNKEIGIVKDWETFYKIEKDLQDKGTPIEDKTMTK